MSLRRSRTSSRKANEASLQGAHAFKNQMPAPCQENLDMDEAALRKFPRAELQKLAKKHNVKANIKSNLIIDELLKLCKVVPLHQDEDSEEPARKKSRTSLDDQTHSKSPRGARTGSSPAAVPPTQIMDVSKNTSLDHATVPEGSPKPVLQGDAPSQSAAPAITVSNAANAEAAATSRGPSTILEDKAPEDDISDSGSDLSYASKNGYYHSPVSSRAGTPPLEEPRMLERAVKIMNQITADDQRILAQIAALRERAATLKEQAQKARDITRAEHGRRERLESYFTYWREIAPEWPQEWLYEEGEEDRFHTEKAMRAMTPPLPSTGPSGPPTLPVEIKDPDVDTVTRRMSLRRRQMKCREEAYKRRTRTTAPPAELKQPDECANRLPSPQSSTSRRGTKRKCRI